jgi:4-carboxymuconolactone decarboxylase
MTGPFADADGDHLEVLRRGLLDGTGRVPPDWAAYLEEAVLRGVWARPALTPRQRSLITVAALATLRCPAMLKTQARAAFAFGVTAAELREVLLQVSGYAGLGIGLEALDALQSVLGAPATADGRDAAAAATSQTRGEEILLGLRPDLDGRLFDVPDDAPPGWRDWLPAWQIWLLRTAFGGLYARPGLTVDERERVTLAVIIALGHEAELRQHVRICRNLAIPPAEIGEEIMHLAVYAGFPAAVKAIRITGEVLAESATC